MYMYIHVYLNKYFLCIRIIIIIILLDMADPKPIQFRLLIQPASQYTGPYKQAHERTHTHIKYIPGPKHTLIIIMIARLSLIVGHLDSCMYTDDSVFNSPRN